MGLTIEQIRQARGAYAAIRPDGRRLRTRRMLKTALLDMVHDHKKEEWHQDGVRLRVDFDIAMQFMPEAFDAGYRIEGYKLT
ncbi:hypothetical protein [Roseivivax halotolerans]|nr:hypothetical protein [Roseivivax halotolerans]